MQQAEQIKWVREDTSITSKTITDLSNTFDFDNVHTAKVVITRHLSDDTFSIKINNPVSEIHNHNKITPFISINNKIYVHGTDSDAFMQHNLGEESDPFLIYHAMIDDFKLHNVRKMYVGLMLGDVTVYMKKIEFHFGRMNGHKEIRDDQELILEASYYIELETPSKIRKSSLPILDSVVEDKEYMIIIPKRINRFNPVEDLASIYVAGLSRDDPLDMIEPSGNKLVTSASTKNLNTYIYRHDNFNNEEIPSYLKSYSHYLGDITIANRTYYDYEKGKTFIGYSEESSQGEYIPFSFHGIYTWANQLKTWNILDGFEFAITHNFDHAVLDSYDGDVILNINNNFETELSNLKTMTLEDLKMIQEGKEIISLRGLERISSEEDN